MKVAIIGGGTMGEAIASSLVRKGLAQAQTIVVSDVAQDRLKYLKDTYHVKTVDRNPEAAKQGQVVILAVKPQVLSQTLSEMVGIIRPNQLVLSIVAGATIDTIRKGLGHDAVVRAIPNTPAQIGQGITVWAATGTVNPNQRDMARQILGAMGKEVYVSEERYVDMATAISGSGPAYVFLFLEAFIDAAVHLGFQRPMAQDLALQTVLGSAMFLEKSGKHPAELRNLVTTPGGTTVEGLLALEEAGLRAAMVKAAVAAHEKSKTLGSEKGS
ncbi:MAG TPA: pyrroline-5-carboxylate reductase [Dehalococcoidia bacterium]|nr:pyrroline-5-carboxylate reductase [Dehalococcoidia bacterium]